MKNNDILDNIQNWRNELESLGPDFIKEMNEFSNDRYIELRQYLNNIFNIDAMDDGSTEYKGVMTLMHRFYELGFYSGVHFGLVYEPNKEKNQLNDL